MADATPLPRLQLLIICSARFAEPVALTVLFPFMYFVRDFHVTDDPNQVGFYVGLLASVFPVAQFISGIPWGWLSDRIGRRPVVIFGLTVTMLCTLAFGFSRSYAWAMTMRIIAGLGNGNVAVLKSMVAELTDKTNQARAFSFLPLTFVLGSIVGPLIGGLLADPAQHFPDTLGRIEIFRLYPYLLPCLVSTVIIFFSLVSSILYLEETLNTTPPVTLPAPAPTPPSAPSEHSPLLRTPSPTYSQTACVERGESSTPPAPTANAGFLIPSACWPPILFYATLSFLSIICDELAPVWLATSVEKGGLSFNSKDIGTLLSGCAVLTLAVQLLGFAPLQYYLGSRRLFRLSILVVVPVYCIIPYINNLARAKVDGEAGDTWVWPAIFAGIAWRVGMGVLSFTSVNLIVLDAARQAQALGKVNAVAQCASYLARGIGPMLCGALWSWSLSNGREWPLNVHFVWLLLALANILLYLMSGRFLVADTPPCELVLDATHVQPRISFDSDSESSSNNNDRYRVRDSNAQAIHADNKPTKH